MPHSGCSVWHVENPNKKKQKTSKLFAGKDVWKHSHNIGIYGRACFAINQRWNTLGTPDMLCMLASKLPVVCILTDSNFKVIFQRKHYLVTSIRSMAAENICKI